MTSIPSSPIDALRSLLPMPGRDGGPGNLPGPGDAPGEGMELEDGRPPRPPGPHWQTGDARDARPDAPPMRGEGAPPLSQADAARLADTLSTVMRHDPSHPLFRELQQLPPEALRQLVQFVTQHAAVGRELAGQVSEPLAQAMARAAPEARDARQPPPSDARGFAEATRAQAQALAQAPGQQMAADRAPMAGGRDTASLSPGRSGEEIRATAMAGAFEARTLSESRPVATLPLAALLARADGTLSIVPSSGAQDAAPASGHPAGHASVLQELAAQQALQARAPGDATPPGRADGASAAVEPGSPGGLLGLSGAAGVTLAAVGNPAGTTHANAPQTALRARKPEETRQQERPDRAAGAAEEEADGEHPRDGRRGSDESGGGQGRGRATDADDGRAPTPPRDAAAAAAGHTAAAGLMLPRHDDDEDADDGRPAGHVGDGDADGTEDIEARHSRRQQWLYWSLIVVTYGCLASALATVAPDLFKLPIDPAHATTWRNALTITGLATGLWAWLLARRMR
ncbi:hypothetical protein FQY83_15645 [Luteimonas marina]|uniref:Uncharacterized protein n=1 Tax=Luteimonas marina TaxID=488485 RepID=A0A5C5TYF8_9GAMM|nr:hypothetical protein [Luteimonas marina]TWT18170.1 hypothetical protein FQY83_15645 [Luteimonas marina]